MKVNLENAFMVAFNVIEILATGQDYMSEDEIQEVYERLKPVATAIKETK